MNILEQKSVEQKLQVLQFKNQKLSSQLDVQRRQISSLEGQITQHEAEKKSYHQSLLCINRIWDQLNQDVQFLCDAFVASAMGDVKHELKIEDRIVQDPFLCRLLQIDATAVDKVTQITKDVAEELSAAEAALVHRSTATRESVSNVLEALRHKHQEWAHSIRQQDNGINQSLLTENDSLTQKVAQYKALSSASQGELKLCQDRLYESERTVLNLQNHLADTEERVSILQKKLYELKNAAPAPTAATQAVPEPSKPSTSSTNGDEAAAEVQELQQLLEKRTTQLDKEKEQNQKLQRQLEEASSKLNDENWVPNTRVYLLKDKETKMLGMVLEQKLKEIEHLARERDEALADSVQKERFALAEQQALKRANMLESQLNLVRESKAELERVKQEVEVQLQKDREKLGNMQTVNELKTMVVTLQKENTMLQKQVKQNKVSADRIEASSRDVQEMVSKLDAKELHLQRLQEQLKERNEDLVAAKGLEQNMVERVGDLRAFVDVLVDFCNDPRELAEVRASEAKLREEVKALQNNLEGSGMQQKLAELEAEKAAVRESVSALKAESDGLRLDANRLNRLISSMTDQLNAVRSECDAYKEEIEGAGSAYEDMQGQNSRLLQQLTERDEVNSQLVAERVKLNQQQQGLRAELDTANANITAMKQMLMEQQMSGQAMDKAIMKLTQDVNQAKEQSRMYVSKLELMSQQLREKEEAITVVEAKLDTCHKQVGDCKAAYEQEIDKCTREASKRQRLEEDLKLMGAKVDRFKKRQAESESISELEEEIEAMRKLLNCNVCNTNQKSVVITKCWHMFCQPCIKKNLDARHRKCPGCGAPFGQTDVKTFFFT